MPLDIEDVIASAVGSVIGRALLFGVAGWLGCSIGAAGMIASAMIQDRTWDVGIGYLFRISPWLVFNMWWWLNVPFVLFSLVHFIRNESVGCRAWGGVVGVESLVVMAGWAHVFVKGWLPLAYAWLVWAALLLVLEVGLWSAHRWYHKRLMREIAMVRERNAQRHAADAAAATRSA